MAVLTEAEARARLERMLAWDQEPALTTAEVDDLLLMATIADGSGWNLRYAAHEGWLWKAGKVAGRFDFSSDVHSFSRDQLLKHCLEMADRYARGVLGTITVTPEEAWDPVIGNLNGGA